MNEPLATQRQKARRRGLLLVALIVLVAGAAWLGHWYADGRNYESTDDAYVSGDVVQITSQVPGTVLSIYADDTQTVHRGQLLATLDPADARIAMQEAEAQLARAVRNVRGLFAQRDQVRALIGQRQADLKRTLDDLHRRQSLLSDGAVSGEELSHSQDAVTGARAALEAAREQLNETDVLIQGTSIATHPQVLNAEAEVRDAALALHRTQLLAPVDGVIAERSVQLGQRVAPGAPLMAVVPLTDVWVDANFKEIQLRDMRVGQPVTLHADLYGGDVDFHGRIAGLPAGSGSAFALLPAQNASGNWIKIVQRVPVRIVIDPRELQAHPLRIGLSMTVNVNVHDTSGPVLAEHVRAEQPLAQTSAGDDPQTEALIRAIVAHNAGGQPAVAQTHPVHAPLP